MTFVTGCYLLPATRTAIAQPLIHAGPTTIQFRATADSFDLPPPQMLSFAASNAAGTDTVPFKFEGVVEDPPNFPNFVVVSPSSGVTPALLWVGLDRNIVPYLRAGPHAVSVRFAPLGQSCPSSCAGTIVGLYLTVRVTPAVTSVVNAATGQPGISPGTIISILGKGLGTPPLTARYDTAGLFPTSLGNSTVTVNGVTAPLLYVSTTRIDAVVPYGLAGQPAANIVVTHNDLPTPAFSVPLLATAPGIFTSAGSDNWLPILNQDSTPNGADNPARRGSVIQMWATGAGVWNRNPEDRAMVLSSLLEIRYEAPPYVFMRPDAPVSVTIGGRPAELQYAGPAPYRVSGVFQVNAVVPEGIGSGPQSVVLTVGENNNSQQNVTVAVQ